jgi:hypothetical protein
VHVLDDQGDRVLAGPGASIRIAAALAAGEGSLVGTLNVDADSSRAVFPDLRIDGPGLHALIFSAQGLAAATSQSFDVVQRPTSLIVETQPVGAFSGIDISNQPVIRILDAAGILVTTGAGATLPVTATLESGSGALSGGVTVAARGGVATFSNLRITGTGLHTLEFVTATPPLSVTSATFRVQALPPSRLAVRTQPGGVVSGLDFGVAPSIELQDATGARVQASAPVTVALVSGSGALQGTLTVTAVDGLAEFTGLRIAGSGVHQLRFTSGSLTAATSSTFTVTQQAASLVVQTQPGNGASGTPLAPQPAVRILDNAGILVQSGTGASLVVTAAVASGSGSVSGGGTATASGGTATFSGLSVSGSGAHTLRFSTASPALSATSTTFSITGPPASVTVTLPQSTVSGNAVQTATATVRDAAGTVLTTPVTWGVSNAQVARVTSGGVVQALGQGVSQITATAGGVSGSASLTVGSTPGQFSITLRNLTPLSSSVQSAFASAAARWSQIIRGDLPSVTVADLDVAFCGNQPEGTRLSETIDDVLIFVQVVPIDGPGGVLGSAGPCYWRSVGGLPVVGTMRFDEADLASLEERNLLVPVILHEMGHVLGIGSRWSGLGLLQDPSNTSDPVLCEAQDPIFTGANGRWGFATLGTGYSGRSVPVENCYGSGTRNGHWRESILRRELMTGFISNTINPLSPLTILSLLDMGYVVDNSRADAQPWFIFDGVEELLRLEEGPPPPSFPLGPDGRPLGPLPFLQGPR